MSYAAMHFVKVNGHMYTTGEIIDEAMDEAKAERLLRCGAIVEIAPAEEAKTEAKPATRKVLEKNSEIVKTAPVDEDIADDEAEAPEIDVMAGIVGETKKKPRRTRK